jgi:hypothetical protein
VARKLLGTAESRFEGSKGYCTGITVVPSNGLALTFHPLNLQ